LEDELRRVKLEISDEQTEREQLARENDQYKKQLAQLNHDQYDLQLVIQKKKSENNEIKQQIAKLDGEIEAKTHETNHMKAQIVQSPEKVKKRMAEVEGSLEKERKQLLELEKQFVHSEAQSKAIAKIENDLNSCVSLLRESLSVTEETVTKELSMKQLTLEKCQLEQQVRDLASREDYLSRLKQNNEEAIARQDAYFQPKIEKSKKKLNKLNQEKLNAEKTKSEIISLMTIEEKKTKMCALDRERLKREYDAEYADMIEASRMVNHDLSTYTQQLKLMLADGAKEFTLDS